MTLYVGTIQEITGKGLEILVDFESKSRVLARFIDGQMDPITQFGLLAFIVGNHETQAMLFKNKQMNGRLTRLMAVQTIPYMSMSVGMMAQTLVAEIAHDKDLQTCAKGYAGYSGISEDERDNACDKTLENAHSASADTRATFEVLMAQLEKYQDLSTDVQSLSEFTRQTKNVDFAGRIVFDEKGIEVFNFGKHKGKSVEQVFKTEPAYYNWMMDGDFSSNTKQVITAIKLRGFGK